MALWILLVINIAIEHPPCLADPAMKPTTFCSGMPIATFDYQMGNIPHMQHDSLPTT